MRRLPGLILWVFMDISSDAFLSAIALMERAFPFDWVGRIIHDIHSGLVTEEALYRFEYTSSR